MRCLGVGNLTRPLRALSMAQLCIMAPGTHTRGAVGELLARCLIHLPMEERECSHFLPPVALITTLACFACSTGGVANYVVRKTLVMFSEITCSFAAFFISASTSGPGLGMAYLLPFGTLPTTTASGMRLTTDTGVDPFYGTSASPASFVSFNSTWVYMCDDGGASTRGVWLFTRSPSTGLYQPGGSSSRVWSAGVCSDIDLVREAGDPVLYWVGGTASAGNGVYRPSPPPSPLQARPCCPQTVPSALLPSSSSPAA